MTKLRFLTSGESHGRALTGIIEGLPSGFSISSKDIDRELKRRQGGYGRGGRMKIESDHAEIISGVVMGKTIGSPIGILIENKDWQNWQNIMSVELPGLKSEIPDTKFSVTRPRPGHADLAGALKYNLKDIRNILERSSARETAMRTALGAIAKSFLSEFNIMTGSFVVSIGSVASRKAEGENLLTAFKGAEKSPVRCPDTDASKKMVKLIDKAKKAGNSLGGIFEVFATGLPAGLGSHIQWDRRLDAEIARAMMGIQAVKGVEIGEGFETACNFGSEVLDEIYYTSPARGTGLAGGFYRKTNHAGGVEGGMTNGMPLIVRAAMKPIPTQARPLSSVDIINKRPYKAAYERSDICAVPAAAVVGEAMLALVIADSLLSKFGGDSMEEVKRNYQGYLKQINQF
ncbi:MAG: chorismate synthase [Nitrospirae bacterium]|nr:chorismate synthase [Nitrospirota bacterium]